MEKTIHWIINAEDLANMLLAGMGITSSAKRRDSLLLSLLEVPILVILFSILLAPRIDWGKAGILAVLLLIMPLILVPRYWDWPRRVRAIARKQKTMLGEHIFTFTDNYFIFKGPYGESKLPWDIFIRWKDVGDYLFLYQSDNLVNYLPKNKLEPDTLEFIRGKIDQNRRPDESPARRRILRAAIVILFILAMILPVVGYYLRTAPR
jgi:hypothetical protein